MLQAGSLPSAGRRSPHGGLASGASVGARAPLSVRRVREERRLRLLRGWDGSGRVRQRRCHWPGKNAAGERFLRKTCTDVPSGEHGGRGRVVSRIRMVSFPSRCRGKEVRPVLCFGAEVLPFGGHCSVVGKSSEALGSLSLGSHWS